MTSPSRISLAHYSISVLLLIYASPALRAAEAYFLIDAGVVTGVDTDTGAVNSFQVTVPSQGLGGMQFNAHNSLYILTGVAGAGDRAHHYTAAGRNTWTQSGPTISQPDLTGVMRRGRGLALQHSGLLLAIGGNSHDLWEIQRIVPYNPDFPETLTAGRVRLFSPALQFPHLLAASPLQPSYAIWFFNGTLLVNNNGTDLNPENFGTVRGLCYDYTGYPANDNSTHSLLYVSDGSSVRRYDAADLQPYGKPTDRSNPVLIEPGTGGMSAIFQIAVDAETGTLYAIGRHPNYRGEFNSEAMVIAGFSTVDGTPRGLGGSTTDPVVYHTHAGNVVIAFAIRPGVHVQTYNGGNDTLVDPDFSDPGKLLSLVNTGAAAATVELPAALSHIEIGGINQALGDLSNAISAVFSQLGSINSMISAAIQRNGTFSVTNSSTVTVLTGATAQDGGVIEVQAGSTLTCPSGRVAIGSGGRLRAGGLIAARSLWADKGGTIAPGASAGQMAVQGNVELLAESVLELEIGGTEEGVTHDVLAVQDASLVSLNGKVVPRLTGDFVPEPTDTFTVFTSNVALSGTIQNLAAGRVTTATGRGSFALTIANEGRDLLLSDYQVMPAWLGWQSLYFTPEQQADPAISGDLADPDRDGCDNLFEFAVNTDPLDGLSAPGAPEMTQAVSQAPTFSLSRFAGGSSSAAGYDADGIRYVLEHGITPGAWNPLQPEDPGVASWIVTPEEDGIMERVTVEWAVGVEPRRFFRLRVVRL